MPPTLRVHALPDHVAPHELAGDTVVVIDVLRASTTIVHALQAGARRVIPCREVDEARQIARDLPEGEAVLGGERGGLRIDGFDLGNSPEQYTAAAVAGKTVVFTTTNGTQAMAHARAARRVLIGAFVNASAVVRELLETGPIHLLCAGTRGQVTEEDLLLAGLLVEQLCQRGQRHGPNPAAVAAREAWLRACGSDPAVLPEPEPLAQRLRRTRGGKNVAALGLDADILAAARIDRFDVVPELAPREMRIRLVG